MTADKRIVYKSGDFAVVAYKLKSLVPNLSDPLTSRSPYSSHISMCDRLQGTRNE